MTPERREVLATGGRVIHIRQELLTFVHFLCRVHAVEGALRTARR